MSDFSIAMMQINVFLSSLFGGTMYKLSTKPVGGNCVIRWSQNPIPSIVLQSFPEKAAIGYDNSMIDPVQST